MDPKWNSRNLLNYKKNYLFFNNKLITRLIKIINSYYIKMIKITVQKTKYFLITTVLFYVYIGLGSR